MNHSISMLKIHAICISKSELCRSKRLFSVRLDYLSSCKRNGNNININIIMIISFWKLFALSYHIISRLKYRCRTLQRSKCQNSFTFSIFIIMSCLKIESINEPKQKMSFKSHKEDRA